jgi:hypothetical protein
MSPMDDQQWMKLSEPERAAEDARASGSLDADLAAAHLQFHGIATACRGVAELAAEDLAACLSLPHSETSAPQKRERLAVALEQAAIWDARVESAARGRLRLSQAELGDVEFMRMHGPLIAAATNAGRVDSGP